MKEITQIRDSIAECTPKKNSLVRPDYTRAEIQALRAVWGGKADARQQRLALDYIVRATGKDDQSYRPGDTHATAFAEGKRFIGTTIVWMLKVAPSRKENDRISSGSEEQGHG